MTRPAKKDTINILGLSAFYHDSAACLVRNGEIIAAAQQERFSRRKHDPDFPAAAIAYCLQEAGLQASQLDYVAFYDKPFIKFERLLLTYLAYAPHGLLSFLKAVPLWLKRKLWLKEYLQKELGFQGKIIFPEHHESHAASAFYPSPFTEAAFLTIDGVGEWATASYGVASGNTLQLRAELQFPHSLGLLYSAFTYFTGFKVNSGEYKLMGLAPYGEPVYAGIIRKELLDLREDGSFRLNMKYFDYCAGLTMTNARFARLFGGPPRQPDAPLTQREMDLAASVQAVTEEIMLRMAHHVHRETGMKKLVLAGGVALNCVGNGRLLREGPFDDIWIQPAAGDAGGALGAALYTWYRYLGAERRLPPNGRDAQRGSYLGPHYHTAEIEALLAANGVAFTKLSDLEIAPTVARLLAEENVVGWFQGRMEFGPRALGNRSILGDPRSPRMQTLMNRKIKFRESFRPFAPAVLVERAAEYFLLDRESPYMLLVAPVRERWRLPVDEHGIKGLDKLKNVRSTIPAVTHVDYSARIQTVHPDDNPRFYALIKAFADLTGCPLLINTSFNVRGEPIVCRPAEALACFLRTDMDYLVIENFLIAKREQKQVVRDLSWQQQFELD
ncbi:MAG: carbamoyltransferase [candidate division KSB1 bacterium]|nr:carbamoyltransferase [candidate division KSB1 bacterium]MDZ7273916.1 carbamoyltransferase [candidate division KSB1 bacterium]MDZ7286072.1 carbamoyltransferase [candidate division KSB1 bacterium]MDZ7299104.1 carbamoyltransferase [candidate division KSB1 bacterium]MDZ7306651.1 carbamoyltransferase [candidate division KSB1 bacterium]